jgi:UPF0755 protein
MRRHLLLPIIVGILILAVAIFIFINMQAPSSSRFKPNTIVHIDSNMPLSAVGDLLVADNVIRSSLIFHVAVIVTAGERSAVAGDYLFATSTRLLDVVARVVHGKEGLPAVKVSIPEGTSVRGMTSILGAAFASSSVASEVMRFNQKDFLSLASTSEGYLFPDTYFFSPNVPAKNVVSTLEDTFDKKLATINADIFASHRSGRDIVIMASILEKEATTDADRRIIAGILWKKIDQGLPLQIDPPFAYAIGKTSEKLTTADLATDSPYNTYIHKGLPPTAINNPGLEALTAAANPTSSDYFFYLSDSKGAVHYAVTYAGHLANRTKYLGK